MRPVAALIAIAGCRFAPGALGSDNDAAATTGDSTLPEDAQDDAAAPRVTAGLVVFYTFEEGGGDTVLDRSGVAPALDLTIASASAATWGTGTLTITGENQVASPAAATKLLDACRTADALTLEAWLQPTQIITGYFPRVVTLSTNSDDLAVTLMAIGDHFEFRMLGPMTDSNGLPSLNTAAGSVTLTPIHVVLVSEAAGTRRVYLDGVERATDNRGGDLASWGNGHKLGLGNEIDGNRAWLGTFDTVAIYARALDATEVGQNYLAGPR